MSTARTRRSRPCGAPGDERGDAEMQSGAARADQPCRASPCPTPSPRACSASCRDGAGRSSASTPRKAGPAGKDAVAREHAAGSELVRPHRRAALRDAGRRHLRRRASTTCRGADRQARRESVAYRASGEAAAVKIFDRIERSIVLHRHSRESGNPAALDTRFRGSGASFVADLRNLFLSARPNTPVDRCAPLSQLL